MNISLTFDIEIWCGNWENLDDIFPAAFKRYIYGKNKTGFALPKTLEILNKYQLQAVFFVEPLFSYRFGIEALKEIVQLIDNAGQDIQLHLHPEWVDEINPAFLENTHKKRPYMSQYSLEEQVILIQKGLEALAKCGIKRPTAFRAGSFACSKETLKALCINKIFIDSSINATYDISGVQLNKDERLNNQPKLIEQVLEYPITSFIDGINKNRHWQVGAVGFAESIELIKKAKKQGLQHLILVSHNFEMLIPETSNTDTLVLQRFSKLCQWLSKNRQQYPLTLLEPDIKPEKSDEKIKISFVATIQRIIAQIIRRIIAKIN